MDLGLDTFSSALPRILMTSCLVALKLDLTGRTVAPPVVVEISDFHEMDPIGVGLSGNFMRRGCFTFSYPRVAFSLLTPRGVKALTYSILDGMG